MRLLKQDSTKNKTLGYCIKREVTIRDTMPNEALEIYETTVIAETGDGHCPLFFKSDSIFQLLININRKFIRVPRSD
jgi:hypothetical protein